MAFKLAVVRNALLWCAVITYGILSLWFFVPYLALHLYLKSGRKDKRSGETGAQPGSE
jgi:hypothetical protein